MKLGIVDGMEFGVWYEEVQSKGLGVGHWQLEASGEMSMEKAGSDLLDLVLPVCHNSGSRP